MRKMQWPLISIGILTITVSAAVIACSDSAGDCSLINVKCSRGAGTSSSTGTGNPPEVCVPGPDTLEIAEDCEGVFLAFSGDDNNDGSKGAPVASFAKAIALAADKKRIYACAEEFAEAVTVPGGISIYGGLDCASNWKYIGDTTKTTIAPMPDMIPLTVQSGDGITSITDVTMRAADATLPGGSSIAAIVDGATVNFARTELVAGAGRDGDKGATPTESVGPTDNPDDPAIRGSNGIKACTTAGADNSGGAAKTNELCPNSIGGAGGIGSIAAGGNGEDGQPLPDPNPNNKGLGGAGDTGNDCNPGGKGQNGAPGMPGTGASGLGTLSATGITGAVGKDGMAGTPGQGGGGGGGAIGKAACGGASGGSGGAGGCGGGGGKGGQAGGSSIALISMNATLTFDAVILKIGAAGNGGEGGDGQDGGLGGLGGAGGAGTAGTFPACNGGNGGGGGAGGKGGGGRGGHAIGIAFMGIAPPSDGASITPGTAGMGGLGADAAGNGQPGVQGEMQKF
jgi:hypothetical protein